MTKNENEEQKVSVGYSEQTKQDAQNPRSEDETRFGYDPLFEGLASVIQRGRMLACMPTLETWQLDDNDNPIFDENGERIDGDELQALVEAWYEAIIGVVPCRFWKEVGLYASRYTKPVDRFTLGQFFEAWKMYCEQGKARGYESWR